MMLSAKTNNNLINPAKLLLSKWTAVSPRHKEKHFLVTAVNKDEHETIISCTLEAVLRNNTYEIDWNILKDKACWIMGWL
jgi:tryptophan-rich hypothetical protein